MNETKSLDFNGDEYQHHKEGQWVYSGPVEVLTRDEVLASLNEDDHHLRSEYKAADADQMFVAVKDGEDIVFGYLNDGESVIDVDGVQIWPDPSEQKPDVEEVLVRIEEPRISGVASSYPEEYPNSIEDRIIDELDIQFSY